MNPELTSLDGKRIVISGGTTGIGRATAIRLAREGAKVLIFGRHQEELDDALADIREFAQAEAIGQIADQSRTEDVQKVFEKVDAELGALDILINNAAIGGGDLIEDSLEEHKYLLDSNLWGYIACTRLAIERMSPRGEGQIVFVGSMSAVDRDPDSPVYAVSKAGNQAFAESVRKRVAEWGIRVTLIEPGLVGTDMSPRPPGGQEKEEAECKMLKAEDITEAIVFSLQQNERVDIIRMQVVPRLRML